MGIRKIWGRQAAVRSQGLYLCQEAFCTIGGPDRGDLLRKSLDAGWRLDDGRQGFS